MIPSRECAWCHQLVTARSIQKHWAAECPAFPELKPGEKPCSRCQAIRTEGEFHNHRDRASGVTNTCCHCARSSMQAWTQSKPKKPDGRKVTTRPSGWVLRPCKYCGGQFSAREIPRHTPRCESNPNRRGTTAEFPLVKDMSSTRSDALAGETRRKKDKALQFNYGIGHDEYDRMLASQGGGCAICHDPPNGTDRRTKSLHVDHDHATGKVRQLLCHYCNLGLGAFKDSPERLAAALEYRLRHHPELSPEVHTA